VKKRATNALEFKALRQLKVKLNRRALERTLQRITDLNVDLGSVERPISWLDLPRLAKRVEGASESFLGLLPRLEVTQCLLWPRRQVELKREPQLVVPAERRMRRESEVSEVSEESE
jgi:hypothetical protein